ncbi:hypothetical protein [Streptomyces monashensis]|uniref:Uncharacterized protein n=1 Tax=Streptomyces monashensis TaxID=1678012 RepID=A0A1S2QS20_9ACTN|nr:hypothetical protein [Streptomyces monashensis]OIK08235.1 hypothetical protein BIV23_00385 [Streptomyces monashensis]
MTEKGCLLKKAIMDHETASAREQQRAASEIGSLADAVGVSRARSITDRLDTIERVLFAVARAQGIDP